MKVYGLNECFALVVLVLATTLTSGGRGKATRHHHQPEQSPLSVHPGHSIPLSRVRAIRNTGLLALLIRNCARSFCDTRRTTLTHAARQVPKGYAVQRAGRSTKPRSRVAGSAERAVEAASAAAPRD